MKHRATGVFILILAALVVAPRASQQLVALKDAAGSRLEATLWNAFLSLNGQHADAASGRPLIPAPQGAPSDAEVARRDRKAAEAPSKARETSRPEARRAGERQGAGAPEQFIAKFETPESLLPFGPDVEGAARFAVPKELPFELGRLLKTAGKRADEAETAARVRAAQTAARKVTFYALPHEAVRELQATVRLAPRPRAVRDARRPAVKHEPERRGQEFDFDFHEADKPAAPHASESHTRR